MRLEDHLRLARATNGDKVAITAGTAHFSYAALDEASDNLAARLRHDGLATGDRVVLFMDNCIELAVAIYAVLKAGAVFSPVNPSTKADKLAFILDNCDAAAVITMGRQLPVVAAAIDRTGIAPLLIATDPPPGMTLPVIDFAEAIAPGPALTVNQDRLSVDDLAMLIYTSGSTGRPKGVMMRHKNALAASGAIINYLENTADDVILNVLPMSFDYGLYQLLMSVQVGARLVLEKSFAFPQTILAKLAAERVTGFPLVPTMAAMILAMRDQSPRALPHLRYITNTAAALPPGHIRRLQGLFPATKIYSMYGLTECKRCTYLPPEELDRRPDSVGIPIPGTEAAVVDDDGFTVPPGTTGELVISGPHVMAGYWQNDLATRKMLRPDPETGLIRLHTGDLFRQDSQGFLYFVGRSDDIIKSRGEKVSPKEVENVLHAIPGIIEATVISEPDPVLGEAIVALVVTGGDAAPTGRDIIRQCAGQLEDFMVPKRIEFRDFLAKSANGKVDRRLMQEQHLEAVG